MQSGFITLFKRSQLIFGIGILMSLTLFILLYMQERREVTKTAQSVQEIVHRGSDHLFRSQVNELARIVRHWERAGGRAKSSWQLDIEGYLKDQTGARTVVGFGSDLSLLWSVLLSKDDQIRLENALQSAGGAKAIVGRLSSASAQVVLARDFFRTASGIVYIVPVKKDGVITELLVTVFDYRELLKSFTGEEGNFCGTLTFNNRSVSSVNCDADLAPEYGVQNPLGGMAEVGWALALIPHRSWVAMHTTMLPWIVLFLGLITTYTLARSFAAVSLQKEAEHARDEAVYNASEFEEQLDTITKSTKKKDNAIRDLRFSLASVSSDAESEHTSATVHDKNRKNLFTLLTVSHDALIGVRLDGTIHTWNIGARKIFGRTAKDMKSQSLSELLSESTWGQMQKNIQQIKSGEPVSPAKIEVLGRNQRTIDVEFMMVPIFNVKNEVHGIYVLMHDLSIDQEQDRQFKEFIDASGAAVLQLDISGVISLVSQESCKLFAYSKEGFQGKHISTLFAEDFWPALKQRVLEPENGNRKRGAHYDSLVRGIRADSTPFAASLYAHVMHRGEDTVALLYITSESYRLSLEDSIAQSERQLQQFLGAIQGRFLPDVQLAQRALIELKGDAHLKQFIKEPIIALKRSEELASNINEYKSFENPVLSTEKVHLNVLVSAVIRRLEKAIQERDILIEFDTPLPHLFAPKQVLSRIYEHLLRNAVQHGSDKPGSEIHLGVKEEEEARVFYVRDQGPGVDRSDRERVFNIFEITNNPTSGSGVGLAIVQRMVHSLGGDIWIEGGIDRGTTVYFRLPKAEEDHVAAR